MMTPTNAYSRMVGALKVVLPLVALGLLSTLFLLSEPPDPERALPFAEVDVAQLAREQRLSAPHFAGVLNTGRQITLTADAAVPDFETTDVIVTDNVTGQIAMEGDGMLLIDARAGRIDVSRRVADLSGDVVAEVSEGYTLFSDAVALRLAEFGMTSPGATEIVGPGLTLAAGSMALDGRDGAAVVRFDGGVRVVFEPAE
jgi:lipopolysaccharide export system protein LptC